MHISVVICTRDRASMLRRALESLVTCRKPVGVDGWEVLVVDNASSDDTPSVVTVFRALLPLRYVRQEQPGLSHARNCSVREARGAWIVWIDDDVTVDAGWLCGYADAIVRHPDATALGGPIAIRLEGASPSWVSSGVASVQDAYAGRSADRLRGQFFAGGEKPYGANFALRRSAAEMTPFDRRLGRHPARPTMGGEETEVIRSVLSKGTGWWVPDASVVHHIDEARQSAAYLWDYFVCAGTMSGRGWYALPPMQRWRDLVTASRRATIGHVVWVILRMLRVDGYRAHSLRNAAWNWGYVKGCVEALMGTQAEPAAA